MAELRLFRTLFTWDIPDSATKGDLIAIAAILANPRYTGRQVWNRQRTDFDLPRT